MRQIRICIVLIVTLFSFSTKGQDFHLSQYDAAPLYLNPALTGMFNGQYRIHGHYRNQWSSVVSPFSTMLVSFDQSLEKFNIGAMVQNDRAGTGNFNVINLLGSGSYGYIIDQEGKQQHRVSGGLQAGIIHKSVNMSKLIFPSQYTSTNSQPFDPGLPNGEVFTNTNILIPQLNLGVLYYLSSDQAQVNPFAGFSVFHVLSPKETFYGNENRLPRRFVAHAGTKVNITRDIQVTPKLLWMNEGNANERTMNITGAYYLQNEHAWIFAGTTYRIFKFKEFSSRDAVIAMVGLKYGKFTYGFSYDINTSSLSDISGGRGGFELAITYIASSVSFPKPACPRL